MITGNMGKPTTRGQKQIVSKRGNSLSVRIPAYAADSIGLSAGSEVNVAVKGRAIIISAAKPRRYDLKQLVDQITSENRPQLIDWGKPVGKEIW